MFREMDGQAVGFRLYGNWTEYVLTVGVGPHPLLNGFSAVTLTALKEARLNREPGALRFTAEGLTVTSVRVKVIYIKYTLNCFTA